MSGGFSSACAMASAPLATSAVTLYPRFGQDVAQVFAGDPLILDQQNACRHAVFRPYPFGTSTRRVGTSTKHDYTCISSAPRYPADGIEGCYHRGGSTAEPGWHVESIETIIHYSPFGPLSNLPANTRSRVRTRAPKARALTLSSIRLDMRRGNGNTSTSLFERREKPSSGVGAVTICVRATEARWGIQ